LREYDSRNALKPVLHADSSVGKHPVLSIGAKHAAKDNNIDVYTEYDCEHYMERSRINRELLFLGEPLPKRALDEVRNIYSRHVIPKLSERYCLESIIFALANEDIRLERISGFCKNLKKLSLKQLYDPRHVFEAATMINNAAKSYSFSNDSTKEHNYAAKNFQNMLESAIEFIKSEGGSVAAANKYLSEPKGYRKHIVKNTQGIGEKLASAWYMHLGGDGEILTLNKHVCMQASNIGVNISRDALKGKKYLETEENIINLLNEIGLGKKYPELLGAKGLNGSMVTTLFWWMGVKNDAGYDMQLYFDSETLGKIFPIPYTSAYSRIGYDLMERAIKEKRILTFEKWSRFSQPLYMIF